jgi:hypothetical protein
VTVDCRSCPIVDECPKLAKDFGLDRSIPEVPRKERTWLGSVHGSCPLIYAMRIIVKLDKQLTK